MKSAVPKMFQGYPVVMPEKMQEIDRRAIQEFGISALELMENAGRGVAEETARLLAHPISERQVSVCCGPGNNGGDGLVAARYLKKMGAEVTAFLAPPGRSGVYSSEMRENRTRAAQSGVSIREVSEMFDELALLGSSDVIIDALLGTGSKGKPIGAVRAMIECMGRSKKPIIAVDIPSGLDPATGHPGEIVVSAAVTCILGLPKQGLVAPAAARYVGELKVLDIGLPGRLLEKIN